MQNKKRVAIIGGGMTGLAAAYKLEQAKVHQDITYDLFEQSDRLGGKIETIVRDGFVIERGPDSFLARKQSMSRLAKEVGLEDELLSNDTGQAYILKEDTLYPMPSGAVMGIPTELKPFATTNLFSPLGKLRALGDFFIPPVVGRDEDISLGHFFRKRLGNEVVDDLIEPLLSGIYAGNLDKLSLKATFPQFQQLEAKHGSLIKGLQATRGSQTQAKDANGKKKGMFLTFRRGLQSFVEAIEAKLDTGSIHKGVSITSIQKVADAYRVTFDTGKVETYNQVIITTPPHITAGLLRSYDFFSYFKEMQASTVATVALGFEQSAVSNPYEGTGFVVSKKSSFDITACTWTHKKWRHSTPSGHALLRSYVGRAGDSAIVYQSDEEIVAAVMKDLKTIMDISGEPLFYEVTRWKKSMPQYEVGHTFKIAKMREDVARHLPGIHIAGAGLDGVGLPDCIDQGERAAERILHSI
ncbi:protoporphyrinogen oxidase [Alkalihalophilus lindianensis]|uniref:Coproporphyrinogen III oxidase n=1 Tax=Alkalihalophilus lindianensis TaxID=1630542 RepID=A0ABU3XEG6_9BACI|nr:protoporphyrinogen oxidase [Alkalihalophilus lindianensis]MDV2686295.1 protoporphyrinogen oxidase [Alkalihalophilus lindianensis]